MELVDRRCKLLCDEFTLKSQIRQNNENISFGYRSDRIFRFVSVSVHNIIQVVSNNTPVVRSLRADWKQEEEEQRWRQR